MRIFAGNAEDSDVEVRFVVRQKNVSGEDGSGKSEERSLPLCCQIFAIVKFIEMCIKNNKYIIDMVVVGTKIKLNLSSH